MNEQACVAFLPFTHVSLNSLISRAYDFEPNSLGDHIRKKRLELGLSQKRGIRTTRGARMDRTELGEGSHASTKWSDSDDHQVPGRYPFPVPDSLQERPLAKRRDMGWTFKKAANSIGVDLGTWRNWEGGRLLLYHRHRECLAPLLGLSVEDLDQEMASRWKKLHERHY